MCALALTIDFRALSISDMLLPSEAPKDIANFWIYALAPLSINDAWHSPIVRALGRLDAPIRERVITSFTGSITNPNKITYTAVVACVGQL